jgi:magnesium transporter
LKHLREQAPDTEEIYYLFVVDDHDRLVGVVSLRELVISKWSQRIIDIMDSEVIAIPAAVDQEEAARLLTRYDLLALPVVDDDNRLLGVITYDDLIEVLEEEATEDIYRLGGVPEGQPADISVSGALKSRLPWLVLNLATAMVSVVVLSVFEDTIAQVAVLAIFFPIVAGVSGSAGTQTLTVIVRGIALGEVSLRNGLKALLREFTIGIADGLVLGMLVAVIALIWQGTPMLGLVVGVSTLLTMIGAGVAGALVPMVMQSLKVDPALASPILVTTITDSLGYFIYLGLATVVFLGIL